MASSRPKKRLRRRYRNTDEILEDIFNDSDRNPLQRSFFRFRKMSFLVQNAPVWGLVGTSSERVNRKVCPLFATMWQLFLEWHCSNSIYCIHVSNKVRKRRSGHSNYLVTSLSRSMPYDHCVNSTILVEGQFLSHPPKCINPQGLATKSRVCTVSFRRPFDASCRLQNHNYSKCQVGEYIATELGGDVTKRTPAHWYTTEMSGSHQLTVVWSNSVITELISEVIARFMKQYNTPSFMHVLTAVEEMSNCRILCQGALRCCCRQETWVGDKEGSVKTLINSSLFTVEIGYFNCESDHTVLFSIGHAVYSIMHALPAIPETSSF